MTGMRIKPALLALSAAGLVSLAGYEGYRHVAYQDVAGVHTVGFGSTVHADGKTPVRPGDRLTPERALITLGAHVSRTEAQMRACIGDVPLHPWEWDAFVSLAYNIGPQAFCRSTIVKRLKQTPPDYADACAQIKRWVYAGASVQPGLVKRREAEYRMCMGEGAQP